MSACRACVVLNLLASTKSEVIDARAETDSNMAPVVAKTSTNAKEEVCSEQPAHHVRTRVRTTKEDLHADAPRDTTLSKEEPVLPHMELHATSVTQVIYQ